MITKIKAEDLAPVAEFVNEDCDGSLLKVCRHLNHSLFLFHYLPEDDGASQQSRINTVWVIWSLKEALMKAWFKKNGWVHVTID